MITTISELLRELQRKEAAKLGAENITHPPTIGAMYEGLTRGILDRVIPQELDLRIVDGFIEDEDGNLSPQVDVMLVTGAGRQIPYTDSYVWHIGNVIAAIEVKKNLFGNDLEDAFKKLRSVTHMHEQFMRRRTNQKIDTSPASRAFALLTGRHPRNRQAINELPNDLSFIYSALVARY